MLDYLISEMRFSLRAENNYSEYKIKINEAQTEIQSQRIPFGYFGGGYDEWTYNQLKHLLEVHERFLSDVRKVLKKLLDRDSLTIIVNFLPLVYRSRSKNFSEHKLSFLHI